MKLYNHLQLSHAKIIIVLANKKTSRYKISQITGISKGKIKRCLDSCEKITRTRNLSQPWKQFRVKKRYCFQIYKNVRDQTKLNRAYSYAR